MRNARVRPGSTFLECTCASFGCCIGFWLQPPFNIGESFGFSFLARVAFCKGKPGLFNIGRAILVLATTPENMSRAVAALVFDGKRSPFSHSEQQIGVWREVTNLGPAKKGSSVDSSYGQRRESGAFDPAKGHRPE